MKSALLRILSTLSLTIATSESTEIHLMHNPFSSLISIYNYSTRLPGNLIYDQKYSNDKYGSLLEVIHLFLKDANASAAPTTACLAVAGPVANNRAQLTNRSSWVIDGQVLGKELNLERIRVINDFVAMGYGLLTLNEAKECVVLQHAPRQRDAPIACIGAGTGLGQCFITPTGNGGYECYGSEGGHAEFAPRNDVSGCNVFYLFLLMLLLCVKHTYIFDVL